MSDRAKGTLTLILSMKRVQAERDVRSAQERLLASTVRLKSCEVELERLAAAAATGNFVMAAQAVAHQAAVLVRLRLAAEQHDEAVQAAFKSEDKLKQSIFSAGVICGARRL